MYVRVCAYRVCECGYLCVLLASRRDLVASVASKAREVFCFLSDLVCRYQITQEDDTGGGQRCVCVCVCVYVCTCDIFVYVFDGIIWYSSLSLIYLFFSLCFILILFPCRSKHGTGTASDKGRSVQQDSFPCKAGKKEEEEEEEEETVLTHLDQIDKTIQDIMNSSTLENVSTYVLCIITLQ